MFQLTDLGDQLTDLGDVAESPLIGSFRISGLQCLQVIGQPV